MQFILSEKNLMERKHESLNPGKDLAFGEWWSLIDDTLFEIGKGGYYLLAKFVAFISFLFKCVHDNCYYNILPILKALACVFGYIWYFFNKKIVATFIEDELYHLTLSLQLMLILSSHRFEKIN